jgi:HTH-type transcriptional regulator, competence development regulator
VDVRNNEDLGLLLRRTREMRGLSLKSVAEPAEISATYLQKLERGEVREPSPHVLHRLSEALGLPYLELMSLAGYVVPTPGADPARPDVGGSHALSSEPLSEEEEHQLVEYLTFLRQRRNHAG